MLVPLGVDEPREKSNSLMDVRPVLLARPVIATVLMAVHNGERYLKASLESIVSQTFKDFEFLIVDDGSTDRSRALLHAFADRDHRLRVISQEQSGLTLALIRGCREAQGIYIVRQDADDISHRSRITDQIALLASDARLGFASCWAEYIGPEGEHLETVTRPTDPTEATQRLLDDRLGPPAHGSVIFRKELYEAVGGYRREFYFAQDSDLWMRMAEQARIGYVPDVRYTFRRHAQSISCSSRIAQQEFGRLGQACRLARRQGRSEVPYLLQAQELTAEIVAARKAGNIVSCGDSTLNYLIGSQLASRGDRRAARYLWSVLRQKPWHWKSWIRLGQAYLGSRQAAHDQAD